MIKKSLAAAGLAATALAVTAAPSFAIGDSDGAAYSTQGAGGTDITGTWGNGSPNFHTADNPNVCLPEVHHVQVGLVPIQADIPVLNQQGHQICNVGQTTQTFGDAPLSHLIG